MSDRDKPSRQINPFTLFLIFILLLASTGALAALFGRGKPVTNPKGGFLSILEILGNTSQPGTREKPDIQAVTNLIQLLSED